MVVCHNVGLSVVALFGAKEDFALYEEFYEALGALGIGLSGFVGESDQGSVLKSVCTKHGNRHLAFLPHLLVGLKPKNLLPK
jgi:hypothetical protein